MESEAKNMKISDLQTQLDDKRRDVTQLEFVGRIFSCSWPRSQSRVRHCQADRSVLVGPADGNIPRSHLIFWSNHHPTWTNSVL